MWPLVAALAGGTARRGAEEVSSVLGAGVALGVIALLGLGVLGFTEFTG